MHTRCMEKPRLSVVVCSIGAPSLGAAVSSIARSVSRAGVPGEILVVWQGSGAAPDFDGQVEVLDSAPAGLSRARNRGLSQARGEIVAFVDEDEEVDPGWAAGVVAACERGGAPGVAGAVRLRNGQRPATTPRRDARRALPRGDRALLLDRRADTGRAAAA